MRGRSSIGLPIAVARQDPAGCAAATGRLKDEDGLSASSVNHYRTIRNSIFNEAVRHGRYDTNPVRAIHQFREPPGRDRFLSVEEFRLLIEKCSDPDHGPSSSCSA